MAFFKAQNLNFRASDLAARKDGIMQAQKTIEAADKGISALISLVEQAQSIAEQAAESGDNVSAMVAASSYTRGMTVAGTGFGAAGAVTVNFTDAAGITHEVTIAVTGTNDTEISTELAQVDTNLSFEYEETIQRNSDGDQVIQGQWKAVAPEGFKVKVTGADEVGFTAGQEATFGSAGSADTLNLQNDFNAVRSEIDALVKDAGYQGINLLNDDDLTVTFNADRTNKYTVEGVKADADSLGLTEADWASGEDIASSITEAVNSITDLRSFASSFGTDNAIMETRREFTENMVNTLENGAAELVNADMNEESANMLALQTRQQMGTISLSIANQAEQSVLRLF